MKNFKFIAVLLLVLALIVAVEFIVPKKIDWSASFSRKDRVPFGNYILYELLPDLFPGKNVAVNYDSAYDSFKSGNLRDMNLIFVNTTISMDKYDSDALFDLVSRGNRVFIAAQFFFGEIAERLGLRTEISALMPENTRVNFTSRQLATAEGYRFAKNTANYHFISYPECTVLGVNAGGKPNFIRVRHGRGCFYLSTLPYAYTNFNMLYGSNSEYIFKTLSHLPVSNTVWDEYYKPRMIAPSTPLRFILSRAPLAWAYYTGMATVLLFIFFKARRKQRIIPVIKPLRNAMLDFVKTVGRLYHQQGDHKNIAEKKIIYFLDRIYSAYRADFFHAGENFEQQLSIKTGIPRGDIKNLFDYIHGIRERSKISEKELLGLSGRMEDFCARAGI